MVEDQQMEQMYFMAKYLLEKCKCGLSMIYLQKRKIIEKNALSWV